MFDKFHVIASHLERVTGNPFWTNTPTLVHIPSQTALCFNYSNVHENFVIKIFVIAIMKTVNLFCYENLES